MSKPELLFPPAADCPDCGKRIRIKWAAPRDLVAGLSGLGHMKCLHCRATHIRAVGPQSAIQETARIIDAQAHASCGHDHGHEGHDPHAVTMIPGNNQFAYIKLPG